ncbi:MAG: virulence RhuM family protein [Bacteroidaceae bacterium]|nr:virulence RhuM family protein [Bacteroidaceae bacterium]
MVCPKCKSQNIDNVDGTYRCVDCGCEWHLSDAELPKTQSLAIRNSTAEFLIFQIEGKEQGVEVYYKEKTVWCTQKAMGVLFDCTSDNISVHLQNIYDTNELKKEATTEKISVVRREGNRDVNRTLQFYNLDAIISVGYRVNSIRATQFRQWATGVLREFAIRGYVLDRKRMENGTFLGEDYFEHLLAEIREIRLSERRFYQKLTDIYATSIDYNRDAPTTRMFFKMVQNKIHFAVHGRTAAELIVERADAEKEHMGLTTWENAPEGKIVKTDVSIAKNYLKQVELEDMGRIVTAVLEFAESRAKRHIPMTMEDWAKRIDAYLSSDERPLLDNAGSVSHEEAVLHAETEFEKYRVIQDRLFESDFDKYMGELPFDEEPID